MRVKYTAKWGLQIAEMIFQTRSRACLKKAFCKMCVTVCGRFCLNEGGVAGYVNRMKVKYAAKWGVQIAGMIFQTRSRTYCYTYLSILHPNEQLYLSIPSFLRDIQ
ncbi:hypothetical protein DW177_01250 [Blautia sp. AM16-16B]|nr:hypothetical protein DW177_01250 [Blautia sp. AM16-16B]